MAKYNVRFYFSTYLDVVVDADNEDEAKETATDIRWDIPDCDEQLLENVEEAPLDAPEVREL